MLAYPTMDHLKCTSLGLTGENIKQVGKAWQEQTIKLIGPVDRWGRKESLVNTVPLACILNILWLSYDAHHEWC
jgi:hypothetical protein